jgi:hypothetical protein
MSVIADIASCRPPRKMAETNGIMGLAVAPVTRANLGVGNARI